MSSQKSMIVEMIGEDVMVKEGGDNKYRQ